MYNNSIQKHSNCSFDFLKSNEFIDKQENWPEPRKGGCDHFLANSIYNIYSPLRVYLKHFRHRLLHSSCCGLWMGISFVNKIGFCPRRLRGRLSLRFINISLEQRDACLGIGPWKGDWVERVQPGLVIYYCSMFGIIPSGEGNEKSRTNCVLRTLWINLSLNLYVLFFHINIYTYILILFLNQLNFSILFFHTMSKI